MGRSVPERCARRKWLRSWTVPTMCVVEAIESLRIWLYSVDWLVDVMKLRSGWAARQRAAPSASRMNFGHKYTINSVGWQGAKLCQASMIQMREL